MEEAGCVSGWLLFLYSGMHSPCGLSQLFPGQKAHFSAEKDTEVIRSTAVMLSSKLCQRKQLHCKYILSLEPPDLADSCHGSSGAQFRSANIVRNSTALFLKPLAQCIYDDCVLQHMEYWMPSPYSVNGGSWRQKAMLLKTC